MLNFVVSFSLRHKGIVVALACLLLGYGLHILGRAKLDVFPNFVQPQVEIQTEAPGLAPEQVEQLVTRPVEGAVNGLGNQESMRSESAQGLSVVTVVFKEGTDVLLARQMLAERLGEVGSQLPAGVKSPKMTPLTSSTMDLLKIGLTSTNLSAMELRGFADWTLKPRLLSVPGVAKCSVFGGEVRQLQILVKPAQLRARDLSLSDVLQAARGASGIRGAGYIETENQRITIQTEGESVTPSDLEKVVVLPAPAGGSAVRLADVASIRIGPEMKFGDALIQGGPGVLLTLSSQFGANTLEVTRGLEAALHDLQPVFERQGIRLFPRMHRPATFIENALIHIRESLILGGVLVAVVIFLLLGHFRTALISVTAIPLSLLGAVVVLDKLGVTLNTITLGGLAIAIGEVVDDAIIDVENIFRRLRENQLLESPRPAFRVVLEASLEVRTAVVYATFVVALVFLPVLTLTGLQGSFFAPLALSYILAILVSLVVAMTLTPALSLLFLGRDRSLSAEPRLQRWLKSGYLRVLEVCVARPRLILGAVFVFCVAGVLQLPFFGKSFLPDFREGHFVIQARTAPGTSLPETIRISRRISEELLKIPLIDTVELQAGRAELGEDPWGPNRCEFHVELKPVGAADEEKAAAQMRAVLEGFPGVQSEVLTFLGDRISETISGETASVVINVFGDDLDQLDATAREVMNVVNSVSGAKDVRIKSPPGAPRLTIRLRNDRLQKYGFRPVDVLDAVQISFQGSIVGQSHQGERSTDIAVLMDGAEHGEPETVGKLQLRSPSGARVPLRELADIYSSSGRQSILREGARRRQTVTCNPEGRDVAGFVAEVRREITARVNFSPGVYAVYSGAAEAQAEATRELLLNSLVAAVGILMLLTIVFRRWQNLMLVLVNLPFALVGGVLAIWLLSRPAGVLNMGALVGFVTLFGITTRNSIMLISHYEHLVTREGLEWGGAAAIRGAVERVVPILMTAVVTALGLAPLAFGSGDAGREIEGPMAIVILGGLVTSTILNLLVLPTLALRYGRFEKDSPE